MKVRSHLLRTCLGFSLLFPGLNPAIFSQERMLVWSEEFDGTALDRSVWSFESGPSNDNIQFYTDREENASVSEGTLRITVRKEAYEGYGYTSAHIRTEGVAGWRYGRMEARIRLPAASGLVPAFWMLPVDSRYGWWPLSGEIDIMEYPSNQLTKIHGTVHTEKYNLFSGVSDPRGSSIDIPDASNTFHLYAVEWSPEKIDFFVDDQKYYTFENDQVSVASWPFDQPFYIILNVAVGGGWVGEPPEDSPFPVTMEVDYVRVYQQPGEMDIQGPDFVTYGTSGALYSLGEIEGAVYSWKVPGDATLTSGRDSHQISVDWGVFGGELEATLTHKDSVYLFRYPVRVSPNLVKNPGFETGVKHYRSATGFPRKASILLTGEESHRGSGSIHAEVTDATGNPWDVQLSQAGIGLRGGTEYHAGVWMRSDAPAEPVNLAVINMKDFSLMGQAPFSPDTGWTMTGFSFTPPSDMTAAFNIDLGGHTGSYYMDDISLTTDELKAMNLLRNADFFLGGEEWQLTTLGAATATGEVVDGEYTVSIDNGGENPWDLHVGQTGLPIEQGFEYTLSFDAYAASSREITPLVGKDGEPWTVFSNWDPLLISTGKDRYTLAFTMTHATDPQARVGFDIGGNSSRLHMDNILLRKGEAVTASENPPASPERTQAILRVIPDPLGTGVFWNFRLTATSSVSVQVLGLDGRVVETLQWEPIPAGQTIRHWDASGLPPGIYLYRLFMDKRVHSGKFLLE